jgi:hypothetical protein
MMHLHAAACVATAWQGEAVTVTAQEAESWARALRWAHASYALLPYLVGPRLGAVDANKVEVNKLTAFAICCCYLADRVLVALQRNTHVLF